jgi:hypothetical protein
VHCDSGVEDAAVQYNLRHAARIPYHDEVVAGDTRTHNIHFDHTGAVHSFVLTSDARVLLHFPRHSCVIGFELELEHSIPICCHNLGIYTYCGCFPLLQFARDLC